MVKKEKKITAGGLTGQPAGGNTIILMQPNRWHKDIGDFRRAMTEAEKVDFPSRVRLYDLYYNILLDTHLSAVLEKRKSAVLSLQIEFSRDGAPDLKIGEMLESPWFRNFLSDLLDTRWWGFSLFQFYPDKTGWLTYDLIPRKHVDPIGERIMRMQMDIHGIPWSEYPDLLAVGEKRDLGNLMKAIPWVLYKQGTTGDWAQFAEVFGMPIREYIYNGNDSEERNRILNDAYAAGSLNVYIHGQMTNMKLLESGNKSGSSELYRQMVNTCNAEISKLVLGNTLTTEASDTGTQALGAVQMKGEQRIVESDKVFILNVLNYQMTDLFQSFGINVQGGRFSYVRPQDTNLRDRILIDTQLASHGLPIADDYWYETYGIPKPQNYDALKAETGKREPAPVTSVPPSPPIPAPSAKDRSPFF